MAAGPAPVRGRGYSPAMAWIWGRGTQLLGGTGKRWRSPSLPPQSHTGTSRAVTGMNWGCCSQWLHYDQYRRFQFPVRPSAATRAPHTPSTTGVSPSQLPVRPLPAASIPSAPSTTSTGTRSKTVSCHSRSQCSQYDRYLLFSAPSTTTSCHFCSQYLSLALPVPPVPAIPSSQYGQQLSPPVLPVYPLPLAPSTPRSPNTCPSPLPVLPSPLWLPSPSTPSSSQ